MTANITQMQPEGTDVSCSMTPEHRAFCLARQAMNACLLAWLRAGGDVATIEEETAPVGAVIQQLIELERHHATR